MPTTVSDALLEVLRAHGNHRGLVLARASVLQDALHCSLQTLEGRLASLVKTGTVEILSPLPFLVLALLPRRCSRNSPVTVRKEQQKAQRGASPIDVPVSSCIAARKIYRYSKQQGDGGAGEGAMLGQVLAVLGPEARREEFARILAGKSPALIHRCLRRVQATKQVRVSRAALFRSLLSRLDS